MFEVKHPYFKKNRILKIEMLELLRDFPKDVLHVYLEDCSDGIIQGLKPIVKENMISFLKVVVKHHQQIYVLGSPLSLHYQATEKETYIKLNFYDQIDDDDFRVNYLGIELDENPSISHNQMEIGRFKLEKGAYLRTQYQDLNDFITEFNTINIVHALYAGYEKPTIHISILKYFAREVLSLKTSDPLDIQFCFLCLNHMRVEREVIYRYLEQKLNRKIEDLSNLDIHRLLVQILKSIQAQGEFIHNEHSRKRHIILD